MNFLKNLIRFSPILITVFVLISVPMMPRAKEEKSCDTFTTVVQEFTNVKFDVPEIEVEVFQAKDSCVPADVQELIYEKAKEHHICFELLLAIVETESGGKTDVVSSTNDFGLMQINQINLGWLSEKGITNILDPNQNIDAGIMILKPLIEKYEEMNLVLMAYNMGEGGAKNLWNQGIYTLEYSRKILNRKGELEND